MKLQPGAVLAIEISPSGSGFKVALVTRVGSVTKPIGSPKVCANEGEAWMAAETFAQDRLARVGLEATKR